MFGRFGEAPPLIGAQRVDLPFGWGSQLAFSVKPLGKQTPGAPDVVVHLIGFVAPSSSVKSSYGTDDEEDDDDEPDDEDDEDDDDEEGTGDEEDDEGESTKDDADGECWVTYRV